MIRRISQSLVLLFVALAATTSQVIAQAEPTVVYLVRHAEKTDESADPALTAQGTSVQGVLRVSEAVVAGVVSLTTLFGELAVSLDGSEHPDPMNHIPRLNAVPVRVEPAAGPSPTA